MPQETLDKGEFASRLSSRHAREADTREKHVCDRLDLWPFCVVARASRSRSTRPKAAGENSKPSDGLEPSTPSLPFATLFFLQILPGEA
jgi:hypothetical protein